MISNYIIEKKTNKKRFCLGGPTWHTGTLGGPVNSLTALMGRVLYDSDLFK